MREWVALLRGINVGGHGKLPMAELTTLLQAVGCRDVATYIQSGNAVFRAETDLSDEIGAAIKAAKGFRPDVMFVPGEDFMRIADANPFPQGLEDPKTLHVFFLKSAAAAGADARLASAKGSRERFHLTDEVMYLYSLDYLSGSKIAARAEKLLGVAATARNWNTVLRLCTMLG